MLLIILLLLVVLYYRYKPSFDIIEFVNDRLLILWYNKDFRGVNRDYIVLWKVQ